MRGRKLTGTNSRVPIDRVDQLPQKRVHTALLPQKRIGSNRLKISDSGQRVVAED